jgi:hypothetical protein
MTCRGGRADNRSIRFQAPSLDSWQLFVAGESTHVIGTLAAVYG